STNTSGISGTSLTKSGTGTMVVTGPLTISGNTTLGGGVLALESATNSLAAAPTYSVSGSELRIDSGGSLSLGSHSFTVGAGSTVTGLLHVNGGNFTISANTTLASISNSGGGGVITVEPNSTATFGNINFGTNDGGQINILGGTVQTGTIT